MSRKSLALLLVLSTVEAKEWLIPAYFHPFTHSTEWQRLIADAASGEPLTVILNPEDGPGTAPDPLYQQVIAQLQQAGGRVLGYVRTCYFKALGNYPYNWCQNLTVAQIKARVRQEIDRYFAWYGVDGIFLDEVTGDAKVYNHYADIADYIRQNDPGASIFANPGTDHLAEPLLQLFDVVVTFEDNDILVTYELYQPPTWVERYSAARFAHLVYNVIDFQRAKRYLAASKHNGYIYITDDGLDGNPWDRLPSYWNGLRGIQPLKISWNGALLTIEARFPQAGNFYQIFFDLDGSPATGFALSGIGADLLAENGYLHRYTGSGGDWSWRFVAPVSFLQNGDLARWTLPFPKLLAPRVAAAVDGSPEPVEPVLRITDRDLLAQASLSQTGSFYQLFLDLDGDPTTGFSFAGLGADYLAENGDLFRYSGRGSDWSWQYVGPVSFSGTTWEIPLEALSYPSARSVTALLGQEGSRWSAPLIIAQD